MLGFELELYSPSEYGMVYWYIYVVSVKLVEKMHHRMSINNIGMHAFSLKWIVWEEVLGLCLLQFYLVNVKSNWGLALLSLMEKEDKI